MNNIVENIVHFSEIRVGDTVKIDGKHKTVCKSNIKKHGFCGITLFGSSYLDGYQMVTKINFVVPTNNGITIR